MKQKKYWKVTSPEYKSLYTKDESWRVSYILGKWVYPQKSNTRLFVFDNLDKAKEWAQSSGGKLFECEVRTPIKVTYDNNGAYGYDKGQFWKTCNVILSKHKKLTSSKSFPENTVFAAAVKLTKALSLY